MITESIIDSIIEDYESGKTDYESDLRAVMEDYPVITGFLLQESNDVLTEDEKDLHWYITTIILRAIEKAEKTPEITDKVLSAHEEANWEVYEENKAGTFYEKVSPLFENYTQEDLLAFVEDMVQLDDESPVTKIGREVIFMSAKSIIDTLH